MSDRTRRQEQQRRDGEVLGAVLTYLVDTDPDRLTANMPGEEERQDAALRELLERRDRLRADLLVLAASHPDPTIASRGRDLAVALYNALTSAAWLVRDFPGGTDRSSLEAARGDHATAQQATEVLLETVGRYGRKARSWRRN